MVVSLFCLVLLRSYFLTCFSLWLQINESSQGVDCRERWVGDSTDPNGLCIYRAGLERPVNSAHCALECAPGYSFLHTTARTLGQK